MESADIPTLDPGATYDTASGALVENIYETLVTYKGKSVSELQGLLATSWTIIELILNPIPRRTGMLSLDALLAGNWKVFWDVLHHLIPLVVTLTTVSSATLLKVTRSSMLEVLSQDYIRTARAKGLPNWVVNLRHARRNALLPVITLASFTVMGLLSGAVITETIFAYPGIGS